MIRRITILVAVAIFVVALAACPRVRKEYL